MAASWNFALKATATCYNSSIFLSIALFNSSINIATDVTFALLPIPIIWALQINKRTKYTLSIILSLGLFACAIAIYKTYIQSQFFKTTDYTYDDSYFVWNSVEFHAAMLAASLPTLRPLFTWFFDTVRTIGHGHGSGQSHEKRSKYGPPSQDSKTGRPKPGSKGSYGMKSIGRSGNRSHDSDMDGDDDYLPQCRTCKTTITSNGRYVGEHDPQDSEEHILTPNLSHGIIVRKNYEVRWDDHELVEGNPIRTDINTHPWPLPPVG